MWRDISCIILVCQSSSKICWPTFSANSLYAVLSGSLLSSGFSLPPKYSKPDSDTGKIKKLRQEKLVKGYSPTDVEAKVTKVFENYSQDWRITAIVESKIDEVIE